MHIRLLSRHEVELIWTIDRSELIDQVYRLEHGQLVARPDPFDLRGWPPGEAETYTPLLYACFDRGGCFFGAFDDDQLVGVAVLDVAPLGPSHDLLQLKMLHVSSARRKHGLGTELFERARAAARERGAQGLYISATPSQNTIDFYRRLGAMVTPEPDPALYALEPDDIHLVCPV